MDSSSDPGVATRPRDHRWSPERLLAAASGLLLAANVLPILAAWVGITSKKQPQCNSGLPRQQDVPDDPHRQGLVSRPEKG